MTEKAIQLAQKTLEAEGGSKELAAALLREAANLLDPSKPGTKRPREDEVSSVTGDLPDQAKRGFLGGVATDEIDDLPAALIMYLPHECVGYVIGKQGSNIKVIQKLPGMQEAKMEQLTDGSAPEPLGRKLSLFGTTRACTVGANLVLRTLHDKATMTYADWVNQIRAENGVAPVPSPVEGQPTAAALGGAGKRAHGNGAGAASSYLTPFNVAGGGGGGVGGGLSGMSAGGAQPMRASNFGTLIPPPGPRPIFQARPPLPGVQPPRPPPPQPPQHLHQPGFAPYSAPTPLQFGGPPAHPVTYQGANRHPLLAGAATGMPVHPPGGVYYLQGHFR